MLPYMLKYDYGFGTGQFSKFNDEVYMIKDEDASEKNQNFYYQPQKQDW